MRSGGSRRTAGSRRRSSRRSSGISRREKPATEQETVLRLERRFDAPRDRVFDAWTNPDVLREWWSAMPSMSPGEIDVDLREGGRYRMEMRTGTGDVLRR
jgi:uncharacterized protein YndB with AHSA1/START domain